MRKHQKTLAMSPSKFHDRLVSLLDEFMVGHLDEEQLNSGLREFSPFTGEPFAAFRDRISSMTGETFHV